MGLFSKIAVPVEDISTELGFKKIKDGGYLFRIEDIKVKDFEDDHATMPGQTAVIVDLLILDGDNDDEIGNTYGDFLRIPDPDLQGKNWEFFASVIKAHFLWFGIPEDVLNADEFDPADPDQIAQLIGVEGYGQLETGKKGFQNLKSFEPSTGADPLAENSSDGEPTDQLEDSSAGW